MTSQQCEGCFARRLAALMDGELAAGPNWAAFVVVSLACAGLVLGAFAWAIFG